MTTIGEQLDLNIRPYALLTYRSSKRMWVTTKAFYYISPR